MALIIETGTGRSDGEAYADAAAFVAWHLAYYGTAATGTTAAQEAAIRRAVRYLDALRWSGVPSYGRAQALAWPRSDVIDRNGYPVAGDSIPPEVIEAQHMLTRAEVASPGVLSPDVTLRDQKVLTEVDGIKWTPLAGGAGVTSARPVVTAAMDRLSGLITTGATIARA